MEVKIYVVNHATVDLDGALRDESPRFARGLGKSKHLDHQSADPDRLRRAEVLSDLGGRRLFLMPRFEIFSASPCRRCGVEASDNLCGEHFFSFHRMNRASLHITPERFNFVQTFIAQ